MKFQRWRPIKRHDNLGPDTRGMRHDQVRGEYYYAPEVDREVKYLLGQLRDMGWTDYREDDAA